MITATQIYVPRPKRSRSFAEVVGDIELLARYSIMSFCAGASLVVIATGIGLAGEMIRAALGVGR